MLKNEPTLAIRGVDAGENEPSKVAKIEKCVFGGEGVAAVQRAGADLSTLRTVETGPRSSGACQPCR